MPSTPTKAAAKKAVKKVAAKAPAKKATTRASALKQHLEAPAKAAAARRTAKKATGDPAKSTAAKPAPAKKTAKKSVSAARVARDEARVDARLPRSVDETTSVIFERVFPKGVNTTEWVEACRRAARDALSAPVKSEIGFEKRSKDTEVVRVRFTQARGLPNRVH